MNLRFDAKSTVELEGALKQQAQKNLHLDAPVSACIFNLIITGSNVVDALREYATHHPSRVQFCLKTPFTYGRLSLDRDGCVRKDWKLRSQV